MTAGATQVTGSAVDARVRLPMELRSSRGGFKPDSYTARYDAVLNLADRRHLTAADLISEMDAAGVARATVHAEYEFGDAADDLNLRVAKYIEENPGRFNGFGTVSLDQMSPMRAAHQVDEIADLGLLGVSIQPAFFDLAIDDARLYPMYARACDLGLVVAVHTGINYTTVRPMDRERPMLLDRVACHFPGLELIASHAAWPWTGELCAVMRRHPTVYAEFGGLAPRYVGENGTGWEVMRRLMDGPLSRQVLFATDWPVFPMERALREWDEMGLSPATLERLLHTNVERLLWKETA